MEAVAFVSDPSLPVWTSSSHGSFEFYELVGVTPSELAESNSLLITDPTPR